MVTEGLGRFSCFYLWLPWCLFCHKTQVDFPGNLFFPIFAVPVFGYNSTFPLQIFP